MSFKYMHPLWGELIYGSKRELQALGIGVGIAFPGETGAPKQSLSCTDPRGFPCKICRERRFEGEDFSASIVFPDRNFEEEEYEPPREIAPGVMRRAAAWWYDEYRGTAEALVAAGIVGRSQFPGYPGMRKVMQSILPNGEPVLGHPKAARPAAARAPGAKTVEKASRDTYKVRVRVTPEVLSIRKGMSKRFYDEQDARLRAMPRPAPLVAPDREANARKRRAELRLAWSKPLSTFTLQPPETRPCR